MKFALKGLQILSEDRQKEYDRLNRLVLDGEVDRQDMNDLILQLIDKMFAINEEIKILENI